MSAPLNARDVLLQSTTPRFTTQPGQDGLTTATVFIYQRNNTGVAPAVPSVNATYTFNPAGLAGLNNGWSFTLPDAAAGAFLFVSRALAASTTATDVLASLDWSAAQLMAKDGAAGAPGANGSTSLYPPLTDAGWASSYGSTATVAVTGAPSGATARRSAAGVDSGLHHNAFFPIDRTRTYRVRFWARASGAGSGETVANGVLYFCLHQHLANGNVGPDNGGRSPYKPASVSAGANQVWTEHSFTWSAADWQAGVTQVRPDYLLNYRPDGVARVGFWEVQGFEMQDVTEVITARAAAEAYALAKSNLAEVQAKAYADGVVDAEEARAIADATTKAEAARVAAVNAAAIDATTKANAAKTTAEAYALAQANLARTTAEAHADGIVTAEEARAIADATAKAEAARVAAVSAAAADATAKANVAATTANWTGIVGSLRPGQNRGSAINVDPAIENSIAWLVPGGMSISSGSSTAPGATGGKFFSAPGSIGVDLQVYETNRYVVDIARIYSLTANLYAAGGNTRNMYIFVNFYDGAGTQITGTGWGGAMSGYTFGGLPPVNSFTRQGADFGPGTGREIPAAAKTMGIGIWFRYNNGSSEVEQAGQDLRLEDATFARAAAAYGAAQATLARTNAEAYADGVVDAEEARAIADATAKAEAARVAAVNAAAADASAKANVAATTAAWAGISGTGKPADDATVGAPAGTYVAGTLAETLASQAAAGNAAATRPSLAITQKANSNFSTPYGNYYRAIGSFVAAVTGAQGTVRYSWTITGGENIFVLASGVGGSTLNLQGKSVVPADADITITCTAVDDSRTAIMTFLHSVDFYE